MHSRWYWPNRPPDCYSTIFSTIHAAVSDEIEQHAARGSNSSAVDGGEGSAKVNLNSCTFNDSSVVVYARESLACGQMRWWQAASSDSVDSAGERVMECGWEQLPPQIVDELIYANSGPTGPVSNKKWQERVLYSEYSYQR